jgi:hypothetical protein
VSVGLCAAAVAAALTAPAQAAQETGGATGSGKGPAWSLKATGADVRVRGLAAVAARPRGWRA